MALLEEDQYDVSYENSADLMIEGRSFDSQSVYGDELKPERRTVIPGNDARRAYPGNLPQMASVEWQGERYPARLSFRYRSGGGSVPVYEFYLDADSRRELSMK